MFWKRGWLVNSLKYQIEKEIRSTLYKNKTFLNNRYNLFVRFIIWGSKHLFLANLLFLSMAFFICGIVATQYSFIAQYLPISSQDLPSIVEFMPNLFIAQVTLVALIFPLAIAFIGVLMQGKSSHEAILGVHRYTSGFLLVSFSALDWYTVFLDTNFEYNNS